MQSSVIALGALLGLFAASGCCTESLLEYSPAGPSAREEVLETLAVDLPYHFVVPQASAENMTSDDLLRTASWIVDDAVRHRPASPDFRCLCALINRYFGAWQRLVIIERMGFTRHEYGFVVVAVTPEGMRALTNLRCETPSFLVESLPPRPLRLDPRMVRLTLNELDRARTVLPWRLLWFEASDSPLYVLHDIKADGSTFRFGICGYFPSEGDRPPNPPLDYTKAAELLARNRTWEAVRDGSPRAKELRSVGGTYAVLLELVWQSVLGTGDESIVGELPPKQSSGRE